MAGTINKVIIVGNLGKDPEIRMTPTSKPVASFTVATSEAWKDRATSEKVEKTEWHNIVVFNEHLVKIVENFLSKGSKVYLEGALKTRKWTDSNNVERYTTEIVLSYNSTLVLLDSRNSKETSTELDTPYKSLDYPSKRNENKLPSSLFSEEIDDEIPF